MTSDHAARRIAALNASAPKTRADLERFAVTLTGRTGIRHSVHETPRGLAVYADTVRRTAA